MASRLYNVTVDARDPRALAEFWRLALAYELAYDEPDEVGIEPKHGHTSPALIFVPVADEKVGKNRLHLDLAPDDQKAEVKRLEGLGARKVDIGQGDVSWVVMADPEGNEFCVLTPRKK
ncbi:MAG TPA: glyoxalase [Chloroflexi bacterium]|nr:glyoxalase [Chloroflexota bacterium]